VVATAILSIAMPVMVTIILCTWYQSRTIDDVIESLGKLINEVQADINAR